jgi:hypothetical protein
LKEIVKVPGFYTLLEAKDLERKRETAIASGKAIHPSKKID